MLAASLGANDWQMRRRQNPQAHRVSQQFDDGDGHHRAQPQRSAPGHLVRGPKGLPIVRPADVPPFDQQAHPLSIYVGGRETNSAADENHLIDLAGEDRHRCLLWLAR